MIGCVNIILGALTGAVLYWLTQSFGKSLIGFVLISLIVAVFVRINYEKS
jgi:hypothetical protein